MFIGVPTHNCVPNRVHMCHLRAHTLYTVHMCVLIPCTHVPSSKLTAPIEVANGIFVIEIITREAKIHANPECKVMAF
jgi:hypothetical protein